MDLTYTVYIISDYIECSSIINLFFQLYFSFVTNLSFVENIININHFDYISNKFSSNVPFLNTKIIKEKLDFFHYISYNSAFDIDHKIAFIVSDKQIYLIHPKLGYDHIFCFERNNVLKNMNVFSYIYRYITPEAGYSIKPLCYLIDLDLKHLFLSSQPIIYKYIHLFSQLSFDRAFINVSYVSADQHWMLLMKMSSFENLTSSLTYSTNTNPGFVFDYTLKVHRNPLIINMIHKGSYLHHSYECSYEAFLYNRGLRDQILSLGFDHGYKLFDDKLNMNLGIEFVGKNCLENSNYELNTFLRFKCRLFKIIKATVYLQVKPDRLEESFDIKLVYEL